MTQCRLNEEERAELLLSAGAESLDPAAISHLMECGSCSKTFAVQSAIWKAMDAWAVPEVSSGFNRELYAKIDADESGSWYDRFAVQVRSIFVSPSLAIGVAAFALIAGFLMDHGSAIRSTQPTVPSIQVTTSEAEQVEKTLDDLDMLRQLDLTADEKETSSKSM